MFKKSFRKGMILASILTFSIGGIASVASAATYSCDNDPTSSSGCSQYAPSTWTHRTSISGALNGDDRLSKTDASQYDYYIWYVNSIATGSYTVKVRLANSAYTNRSADYYGGRTNEATWSYLGRVNQYSAPSGWTTLSSKLSIASSGKAGVEVDGYDHTNYGTATGADAIELTN